MKDYDALKALWQQAGPGTKLPELALSNTALGFRQKLQRQLLSGAVSLLLTVLALGLMALCGLFPFVHWYTYGAVILVVLICLLQSAVFFQTLGKLRRIDDTVAPAAHLEQWRAYYYFRQRQQAWNMPLYFVLLNIAMGIYFIEVLGALPLPHIILALGIYIAWMCFAWFYLGRRSREKEHFRLKMILEELAEKERSFRDVSGI